MVFILGRDPTPSLSSDFGEPWKGRKLPISKSYFIKLFLGNTINNRDIILSSETKRFLNYEIGISNKIPTFKRYNTNHNVSIYLEYFKNPT